MAHTDIEHDLDALTQRAAKALVEDLRARLEEALKPILDDVTLKAAEDLRKRLAVKLASHYNVMDQRLHVNLIVDGVKQP
jgi:hypothetical protein